MPLFFPARLACQVTGTYYLNKLGYVKLDIGVLGEVRDNLSGVGHSMHGLVWSLFFLRDQSLVRGDSCFSAFLCLLRPWCLEAQADGKLDSCRGGEGRIFLARLV